MEDCLSMPETSLGKTNERERQMQICTSLLEERECEVYLKIN